MHMPFDDLFKYSYSYFILLYSSRKLYFFCVYTGPSRVALALAAIFSFL